MRKMNFKKYVFAAAILLLSAGFVACSDKDDDVIDTEKPTKPIENITGIDSEYVISRSRVLTIAPTVDGFTTGTVAWTVSSKELNIEDSIVGTDLRLNFITLQTGKYDLTFKVKQGEDVQEVTSLIEVKEEATAYSAYIDQVFDFLPAIGQFTNKLPVYEKGDTHETMIKKAEKSIKGPNPSMISLGGFGGYVEFGFDHTVMNVPGKRDFRVLGNAFYAANLPLEERAGSIEPGVIMVAYDANKNGKPDADEWYEIAGSVYDKSVKNYEITYYKPDPTKEPVKGPAGWQTDIEHVKWEDNQGESGYKTKNSFHNQSYFPEWFQGDKLTFRGTLLPVKAVDTSGTGSYWVMYAFAWGYADNAPNNQDESGIDIDWAVDKNGDKVHLPGIDFVKVYTGGNLEAGWLGENSTEVAGAYDMHLKGESVATEK